MESPGNVALSCVNNTIHFIENNFSEVITAQDLENVSNYSYRNIQRIFKYSCGITIGAYQKRLRVENAYKLMLYTTESLTAIAYKVGFANLASFSKAFRQHYGISPKAARAGKHLLLTEGAVIPVESAVLPTPEIIYLPAVTVYYESAFIPYDHEKIERLWERFMRNEFPQTGLEYFGVIADDPLITAEINCRYDTCCTQPDLKKTLPSKTILGGRYAAFIHSGKYETIEETYTAIYARWMPASRLEFAPAPVIERYMKHPGNTADEASYLTSILLPLK